MNSTEILPVSSHSLLNNSSVLFNASHVMESPSTNTTIQWKNPGMSCAADRDENLTVDQIRAFDDICQYLVLNKILKKAQFVMDVGCGSGHSTFQLVMKSDKNCQFLGVDTSENIEFAKQKYIPCASHQNLNYQAVTSPFELPLCPQAEGWNIMTALAFFSWIPLEAQPEVLRGMYDRLAPEGYLLVRTQAVQDRPYRRAADDMMKLPKWAPYFVDYVNAYEDQTAEGFEECLKEAGFSDIHCIFHQDASFFSTKASMVEYFLQWLPQLSAINGKSKIDTQQLHKTFITEVIDRYCEIINSTGINIVLNFPCVLATARKKNEQIPVYATKA